jgi:hypothetical protein
LLHKLLPLALRPRLAMTRLLTLQQQLQVLLPLLQWLL